MALYSFARTALPHTARAASRSLNMAARAASTSAAHQPPAANVMPGVEYDLPATSWKALDQQRLTRQSFQDLLAGRIPAIREPGFVSPDACSKFEEHLGPRLSPYTHIAGPRVDKVGVAQFEFQAQSADDFKNRGTDCTYIPPPGKPAWASADPPQVKDRYFSKVDELEGIHEQIAAVTGDNPMARLFGILRRLFPELDVSVAREVDGRRYHCGIYRSINNSTPIHCDWSPYDSATEDWIVNRITHQTVFNLYLAPVSSGETVLYDRQWTPDVLDHRDPQTYGYFPGAVSERRTSHVRPDAGDLVFFNTRNLHEVKAVAGEWKRPRLTMSSFLGLLPAGVVSDNPRLILWS